MFASYLLIVFILETLLTCIKCHDQSLTHVFQEKSREKYHPHIKKLKIASISLKHTLIIAIQPPKHSLNTLKEILNDISDPFSENYGKHWTKQRVDDFTCNFQAFSQLFEYLHRNHVEILRYTKNYDYVYVSSSVETWNKMFKTIFHEYHVNPMKNDMKTHENMNSSIILRADEYSLPIELIDIVLGVYNIIQFPSSSKIQTSSHELTLESMNLDNSHENDVNIHPMFNIKGSIMFGYVTPELINRVYRVNNNTGDSRVSQGIYESIGQQMSLKDLNIFQKTFNISLQGILISFMMIL